MVDGECIQLSTHGKAARDYLPIPSAEVGIEREISNARRCIGAQETMSECGDYAMAYAVKGTASKIAFQASDSDNIQIQGTSISRVVNCM